MTEAGLEQAVAEAAQCPFDLAAQIPVRARLLRLAGGEHVLVVVIHHIAGGRLVHRNAGQGCVGGVCGPPDRAGAAWAPLPVQYADYALWQRELLGDRGRPGQPAGRAGRLLARRPGRSAGGAGPAGRPAPARDRQLPRPRAPLNVPAGLHQQLAAWPASMA